MTPDGDAALLHDPALEARPSLRLQLDRWWQVLRHHRPEQLARRLTRRVVAPFANLRPWRTLRRIPPVRACWLDSSDTINTRQTAPSAPRPVALTLLNLTHDLGWPIDWRLASWPAAPRLWAFELHGHGWLVPAEDSQAPNGGIQGNWQAMVESWIAAFPADQARGHAVAWHPYCISRRIPIWCRLHYSNRLPAAELILASLANQTEYLSQHLERDLGGNHLWENARALATAGAFFDDPNGKRWLRQGLHWIRHCLNRQVSEAGEHYERSPMYQARLVAGLTDLADWMRPVDRLAADCCAQKARQMASFVDGIRHPDGGVPLFGDTTLAPVIDNNRQDGEISWGHWHGEYFVVRQAGSRGLHEKQTTSEHCLLWDAGNLGADDLPAHAHADLLGFELSAHGRRLFVDSGVYAYAAPQRDEFRRSEAHNVLTIDDRPLADVWREFRMGRRGHVRQRADGLAHTQDGTALRWACASHDAYRPLGLIVQRWWVILPGPVGPWFSIHWIQGARCREHQLREYLHCHPDVTVELTPTTARLHGLTGPVIWELASAGEVRLLGTQYSPGFYQAMPNTTLVCEKTACVPTISAWSISFGPVPVQPSVAPAGDGFQLSWTDGNQRRRLIFAAANQGRGRPRVA